MDWKKKAIFAVGLLGSPLWAETTYTYVALNQNVPKLQDILDQGVKGSKQSLFETKVIIPPNTTTYIEIQITPMNDASDANLKTLEQNGALIKLSEDILITETTRGELVTSRSHADFNKLPQDFATVYDVQKATIATGTK